MKKYLTTLFTGALLLGAAGHARADHLIGRQERRPGEEPQVFNIDQHNDAMRRAVHQARRTVGVFIEALGKPKAGQTDFEVKKPFKQGNVVEHLWLADVTFSGNRFHGYVDNMPRQIKRLKMGDRVSVNPNEISDWAFVDNGRLIGGYTIRVIYYTMSPAEKAAFEKEARFHIENHS